MNPNYPFASYSGITGDAHTNSTERAASEGNFLWSDTRLPRQRNMGFSLSITEIAIRRMQPWPVTVDYDEADCSAFSYFSGNPAGLPKKTKKKKKKTKEYDAAVVRPENKIH